MGSRVELQSILEKLLGSRNVYYQPPETLKMQYPAIVYNKSYVKLDHADDTTYNKRVRYELIVIAQRPDHPVVNKLLDVPYCSYERHFNVDNLNHDVLTLYY